MKPMKSPARHAGESYREWVERGLMLRRRREHSTWELGDWLVDGVTHKIDVDFAESVKVTGYSKSHLYNLRRVAEGWPKEDRHYTASWGVHRECLRERDPDARRDLLLKAIKERWTSHEVRDFLRDNSRVRVKVKKTAAPSRRYVPVHVECPHCKAQFPVKGHRVGEIQPLPNP